MKLIECEVLTPWAQVQDGGIFYNKPLVAIAHLIDNFEDVTNQDGSQIPPAVNLTVVRIEIPPDKLKALQDDHRFCVLWHEEFGKRAERRSEMPVNESEKIRDFLNAHSRKDALDIIGTDTHLISRTSVAFRVKNWARRLQK